jgi:predicted TIM-barrel fold metal-dependent hydrolase
MVTLNLSAYLDPYPSVTVQVANLGGTIPFLVERMEEVARAHEGDGTPLLGRAVRCYVDTASFGPRGIAMAVACFGADRVMLGTDCPIFDTPRMLKAIAESRLDAQTLDRVRFGNAHDLFVH